jgi:hypothetical protein
MLPAMARGRIHRNRQAGAQEEKLLRRRTISSLNNWESEREGEAGGRGEEGKKLRKSHRR